MAASTANAECITGKFKDNLSKLGFEVYPLKVLLFCFATTTSSCYLLCGMLNSLFQVFLTLCNICLQVGWYNSVLSPNHRLAYPDETLAVVVLSTPSMFEDAFLPFLKRGDFQGLSDPIDQCVRHCVSSAVLQVCFINLVSKVGEAD